MDSELSQAAPDPAQVAAELDAVRDRARAAYFRRDVNSVMAMFLPGLAYTQPDGRTIGYDRLARDVRIQLDRMDTASTEFRRETLEVPDAATAIETLEQRATFAVRAFGFLRREWTMRRRGRYEWVRTAGTWQVRRVQVDLEELTGRFSIGLR